jgi:hypothetical protein
MSAFLQSTSSYDYQKYKAQAIRNKYMADYGGFCGRFYDRFCGRKHKNPLIIKGFKRLKGGADGTRTRDPRRDRPLF